MGSQKIVLPFFVVCIVLRGPAGHLLRIRSQKEIQDRRVVQNAMDVSPHATVVDVTPVGWPVCQPIQGDEGLPRLVGHRPAHVDFIAPTQRSGTAKTELHLTGHFLPADDRMHGQ